AMPISNGSVFIGTNPIAQDPNSGIVTSTSLSGGFALDTTAGPLKTLSDKFGLSLTVPADNVQLKMGSDLKDSMPGVPLANALPYLTFTVSTQTQVSLGGVTVSPNATSFSLTSVLQPSDPSLFLKLSVPGRSAINDVALG